MPPEPAGRTGGPGAGPATTGRPGCVATGRPAVVAWSPPAAGSQAASRRLPGRRQVWLTVEYIVLFFAAVALFAVAGSPGGPIPPLVVLAVAALLHLRRQPGFDRADLARPTALRRSLRPILRRWTVAAVAAVAVLALVAPQRLFEFPRERPLLWAAVVVCYPLLSVYPQELLFRAFLMHRYTPLFGGGTAVVAASAAAFGFAHVIFGSFWSVALTLVGGWLFARRYQRTRSLLTASVEHTLYGLLAFTVGPVDLFYRGMSAA